MSQSCIRTSAGVIVQNIKVHGPYILLIKVIIQRFFFFILFPALKYWTKLAARCYYLEAFRWAGMKSFTRGKKAFLFLINGYTKSLLCFAAGVDMKLLKDRMFRSLFLIICLHRADLSVAWLQFNVTLPQWYRKIHVEGQELVMIACLVIIQEANIIMSQWVFLFTQHHLRWKA